VQPLPGEQAAILGDVQPGQSTAGIAATVISGCSGPGNADVNPALPAPELHPAAKIVTPKSHRAKKLRVRIVVLPPNPSRDRDRAPQWHGLRNNRPFR
jgi:hypothetical protein